MTSTLSSKAYLFLFVFFIGLPMMGQESTSDNQAIQENLTEDSKESNSKKPRLGAISTGYVQPIPTGDNFAGKGLRGKSGVEWNAHLYVFKGFFAGGGGGLNYFSVKDPTLLGGYKETRVVYDYFYLGYELSPIDRVRLGASVTLGGKAKYKNKSFYNSTDIFQTDTAKMTKYTVLLSYELMPFLAVYFDYAYRVDKTDILTSGELHDFFAKAKYHNLAFGLKFSIGNSDFVSMFGN